MTNNNNYDDNVMCMLTRKSRNRGTGSRQVDRQTDWVAKWLRKWLKPT